MDNHSKYKIKKLITESEINVRIENLAQEINQYYVNHQTPIVIIGVLKSCMIFFSKLITKLNFSCEIDFFFISSFQGKMTSQTAPKIKWRPTTKLVKRDILLIEDIIDSGNTIQLIMDYFHKKRVSSVKLVSFLVKQKENQVQKINFPID
jgi:hypoxanthine phosphoribosyltransferase